MLTILIPCAGEGRRFREAGYKEPKPLIPVRGTPMLRRVIENVRPPDSRLLFVLRDNQGIAGPLHTWGLGAHWSFTALREPTDGAARTCLAARHMVNLDAPLLICNCDQLVEGGIQPLLDTDTDCAVLTMERNEERWSYLVRQHSFGVGRIDRIIEKPKWPHNYTRATTGHYYFRRAGDFFAAAECMINLDDRTNGEFYVAPSINYLLAARKKVVEVKVEDYGGKFVGLGTPEDLKAYEEGV